MRTQTILKVFIGRACGQAKENPQTAWQSLFKAPVNVLGVSLHGSTYLCINQHHTVSSPWRLR